jgi:hypothetical protein
VIDLEEGNALELTSEPMRPRIAPGPQDDHLRPAVADRREQERVEETGSDVVENDGSGEPAFDRATREHA